MNNAVVFDLVKRSVCLCIISLSSPFFYCHVYVNRIFDCTALGYTQLPLGSSTVVMSL